MNFYYVPGLAITGQPKFRPRRFHADPSVPPARTCRSDRSGGRDPIAPRDGPEPRRKVGRGGRADGALSGLGDACDPDRCRGGRRRLAGGAGPCHRGTGGCGQRRDAGAGGRYRMGRGALCADLSGWRTGATALCGLAVGDAGGGSDPRAVGFGRAIRRGLDCHKPLSAPPAAVLPRADRGTARGLQEIRDRTAGRCRADRGGCAVGPGLWHNPDRGDPECRASG